MVREPTTQIKIWNDLIQHSEQCNAIMSLEHAKLSLVRFTALIANTKAYT